MREREYELIFIVHPDLDDNSFNEVVERVSGWITDAGGSIVKEERWGRKKLAYSIRKQREGQYVFMHTKMPTTFNTELDRNLRYLESVMRHMIVVIE